MHVDDQVVQPPHARQAGVIGSVQHGARFLQPVAGELRREKLHESLGTDPRPPPEEALVCTPAVGDMVAVIGENRRLLIFPLEQLNEMTRGRGVRLQRYKDGDMSDVRVFSAEDGLTWIDAAGRTFTVKGFSDWLGARAQAGRLPPNGFPKNNRFGFRL